MEEQALILYTRIARFLLGCYIIYISTKLYINILKHIYNYINKYQLKVIYKIYMKPKEIEMYFRKKYKYNNEKIKKLYDLSSIKYINKKITISVIDYDLILRVF